MANFNSSMILMMITCVVAIHGVAATVYTVGDSSGWSMGGTDYSTWANDKTFAIGDTLVFNYVSGHTVDEVSPSDYKTCTTGNAIVTDSSGATSVLLKTAGTHYFICGIPGHCGGGMKLSVNVGASTASPGGSTSTTTTATSPESSTAPATSPSTSTSGRTSNAGTVAHDQPASSSSTTLSPFVALFVTLFAVMVKSF